MDWSECIKKRIAKDIQADENMIYSLIQISENKMKTLSKIELDDITAASKVLLAYDSLREILEALAIKKGFKIYNHECYTHFLKEILNDSIKGDEFDELRIIRNSINYYGKPITTRDAGVVIKRIILLRNSFLNLFN